MPDIWNSPRQRILQGWFVGEDAVAVTCAIHNASRAGALLHLSPNSQPPSAFELVVPNTGNVRCSVVRRSRGAVAVRFNH
jgi:hypothetical protein